MRVSMAMLMVVGSLIVAGAGAPSTSEAKGCEVRPLVQPLFIPPPIPNMTVSFRIGAQGTCRGRTRVEISGPAIAGSCIADLTPGARAFCGVVSGQIPPNFEYPLLYRVTTRNQLVTLAVVCADC